MVAYHIASFLTAQALHSEESQNIFDRQDESVADRSGHLSTAKAEAPGAPALILGCADAPALAQTQLSEFKASVESILANSFLHLPIALKTAFTSIIDLIQLALACGVVGHNSEILHTTDTLTSSLKSLFNGLTAFPIIGPMIPTLAAELAAFQATIAKLQQCSTELKAI